MLRHAYQYTMTVAMSIAIFWLTGVCWIRAMPRQPYPPTRACRGPDVRAPCTPRLHPSWQADCSRSLTHTRTTPPPHPPLLAPQRGSALKRLYRAPLDALEQATTGMAHLVLVNSRFTAHTFKCTFTRLHARGLAPEVRPCSPSLHPLLPSCWPGRAGSRGGSARAVGGRGRLLPGCHGKGGAG
jgi:hypothetical protein